MASLQQLRRRIKSIESIHQITRAMEMIATSKMQKATKKAVNARDYSASAKEILSKLQSIENPLLKEREVKNIGVLFATSDRGLCGGFNSSLYRELHTFVKEANSKDQKVFIMTVGKKGRDFVAKNFRDSLIADFSNIKDEIYYEEITPIAHEAVENFLNQKIDQFYIIYSHWVSSFIQKPACIQILPVVQQEGAVSNDYLLEPSSKELLNTLLPQFIEVQIYQALLESKASEYSARMMAMKNSTENAKDLMDELYLTYHSLRQSAITSELTEMTVAKQAME